MLPIEKANFVWNGSRTFTPGTRSQTPLLEGMMPSTGLCKGAAACVESGCNSASAWSHTCAQTFTFLSDRLL